MKTEEQKISYLTNLFAETYLKDIIERHNGCLDIYPKKNVFRVGITLPLN